MAKSLHIVNDMSKKVRNFDIQSDKNREDLYIMAKIIVQENEIAILTIWEKIYNSNFNYGEFAVIDY